MVLLPVLVFSFFSFSLISLIAAECRIKEECWDLTNPASPSGYHAYCSTARALARHPSHLFPSTNSLIYYSSWPTLFVYTLYSKRTIIYLFLLTVYKPPRISEYNKLHPQLQQVMGPVPALY
jgi:hypothetical protein